MEEAGLAAEGVDSFAVEAGNSAVEVAGDAAVAAVEQDSDAPVDLLEINQINNESINQSILVTKISKIVTLGQKVSKIDII